MRIAYSKLRGRCIALAGDSFEGGRQAEERVVDRR
jgi:hypothetical protein